MLSAAKHLAAYRNRPFAALRVTLRDSSNCQALFFTLEPCLRTLKMEAQTLCLHFITQRIFPCFDLTHAA
jgi:hypothetical protein